MQADFRISGCRWCLVVGTLLLLMACGQNGDPQARMQRAKGYFVQGDYRSSSIELKNILSEEPANRDARLLLARVHLKHYEGELAEKEIRKARELGAGKDDYLVPQARAFYMLKAYDRLLNEINVDELSNDDAKAEALILRGNASRELEQYDEAMQAYTAALKLDGQLTAPLVGMATVELANDNPQAARGYLDRVLASDDGSADAWYTLGLLERSLGQIAEAEAAFARVIRLTRNSNAVRLFLLSHNELITLMLDKGKADAARQLVNDLAEVMGDNPLSHYFNAMVAYQEKDSKAALSAIQKFRSVAPDHLPGRLLEGAIHFALGNYEQADMLLSGVVSKDPDNVSAYKILAATKVELKETGKALDIISAALRSGGMDPFLLALAAKANLQSGNPESTIAFLEDALRENPDSQRLKEELVSAQLNAGKVDDALNTLKASPLLADNEGVINRRELLLVSAYIKNKDFAAAKRLVDEQLQAHPDDVRIYNLAGVVHIQAGDPGKAQQYFEKAITLQGDYKPALLNLARLAYRQKDYGKAEVNLKRLRAGDPDNPAILFALASLGESRGNRASAIEWLEHARRVAPAAIAPRLLLTRFYMEQGKEALAYEVIREAWRISPQRPDILSALAFIQMRMGKKEQALENFSKATELSREPNEITIELARAQLLTQDSQGAKDTLVQLLKRKPGYFTAASMLASIEARSGNSKEAFRIAREQQQKGDNAGKAYSLEGDIHMISGNSQAAVNAYLKSADISPGPDISVKLFAARRKAGLPDPYLILEQWLAKNPDDGRIRSVLADAYFIDGMSTQAIRHYETIIINKPEDGKALNNLALLYGSKEDPRAIEFAEKAHVSMPEEGAVTDTLGWLLVQYGDPKRAAEILHEAIQQAPEIPDIQYHYAVALARLERKEEARRILEEITGSGAQFADLPRARMLLEKL